MITTIADDGVINWRIHANPMERAPTWLGKIYQEDEQSPRVLTVGM